MFRMLRIWVFVVLVLCAPALCFAAEEITLGSIQAAGGKAMTKAEVLALALKKPLRGEVGEWSQPLRLNDDGTLRGESGPKGGNNQNPARGTGTWSVDDDGTFHLFLDWGRWGKHDWVGKLYQHGDYVYQIKGDEEGSRPSYRFKI